MSKLKPIEVLSILSPVKFIVTFNDESDGSAKAIKFIEKNITNDWNILQKPISRDAAQLGTHVSVHLTKYKRGRRGIIQQIFPKSSGVYEYKVFLYDYGIFENASAQYMGTLLSEFILKMEPRSKILTLPGFTPAKILNVGLEGLLTGKAANPVYVPGDEWTQRGIKFVIDWLKDQKLKGSVYKHENDVKIFGDICIYREGQKASLDDSLSKTLEVNHIGLFSLEQFQREASTSADSSDEEDWKGNFVQSPLTVENSRYSESDLLKLGLINPKKRQKRKSMDIEQTNVDLSPLSSPSRDIESNELLETKNQSSSGKQSDSDERKKNLNSYTAKRLLKYKSKMSSDNVTAMPNKSGAKEQANEVLKNETLEGNVETNKEINGAKMLDSELDVSNDNIEVCDMEMDEEEKEEEFSDALNDGFESEGAEIKQVTSISNLKVDESEMIKEIEKEHPKSPDVNQKGNSSETNKEMVPPQDTNEDSSSESEETNDKGSESSETEEEHYYESFGGSALDIHIDDENPSDTLDEEEYFEIPFPSSSNEAETEEQSSEEVDRVEFSEPEDVLKEIPSKKLVVVPDDEDQSDTAKFKQKQKEHIYQHMITPCSRLMDIPGKTLSRGKMLEHRYEKMYNHPLFYTVKDAMHHLDIEEINSLQKSAWPHVTRGRNVFIVSGNNHKAGGTLSYLVPILANLLDGSTKKLIPPTSRPSPCCIILCANSTSGNKILHHVDHVVKYVKNEEKIFGHYFNVNDLRARKNLRDGCEIVITTPDLLIQFLDRCRSYFSFDRLMHLVIDDAHVLLKTKTKQLVKIFDSYRHHFEQMDGNLFPLQTIICSNTWSNEMIQAYLELVDNPVLVIGSPFQALLYANVKVVVHHVKPDEKLKALTSFFKKETHKRIVIICATDDSCQIVRKELEAKLGTIIHFVDDTRTSDDVYDLKMRWRDADPEESLIYVLTDDRIREVEILNTTKLIHYELPQRKLDAFGYRFSLMWNNFYDISKQLFPEEMNDPDSKNTTRHLVSHVILTNEDAELHKVVKALSRISAKIPPELQSQCEMLSAKVIKDVQVCGGILQYGFCNNQIDLAHCKLRHFFTKEEVFAQTALPRTGEVEVNILEMKNPAHYIGQILRYSPIVSGKRSEWTSYIKILKERRTKLNDYYSDKEDLVETKKPEIGKIIATLFKDGDGDGIERFVRGRILKVTQRTSLQFTLQVRLFLIDEGEWMHSFVENLFDLPEEFVAWPPICVDIYLADMKPSDDEKDFNDKAYLFAKRIIIESKIFVGKIVLSMGNSIWLNPVYEMKKTRSGEVYKNLSLRNSFLTDIGKIKGLKFADLNESHMRTLYALCKDVGFVLTEYDSMALIEKEKELLSACCGLNERKYWAYMSLSSVEDPVMIEAYASFVVDPHCIFVQLSKFYDLVQNLDKEIQKHVDETIEEFPNYASSFLTFYSEGVVVAAKADSPEEQWCRAIVTNIKAPFDELPKFQVFYVDYGGYRELTSDGLFPLPRTFLYKLPFQAIRIRLNHLSLNEGEEEWSEETFDYIFDTIMPQGMSKCLFIVVNKRTERSLRDEMSYEENCYDAFVFLNTYELGVKLNEDGMAHLEPPLKNTIKYVQTILTRRLNESVMPLIQPDDDDDTENDAENALPIQAGERNEGEIFFDDEDLIVNFTDEEMIHFLGLTKKNGTKIKSIPHLIEDLIPNEGASNEVPTSSEAKPCCSKSLVDRKSDEDKLEEARKRWMIKKAEELISEDGLKKANVYWSQNKQNIFLRVDIPDVKETKVEYEIEPQSLKILILNPPGYGFHIKDFFGKLDFSIPPIEKKLGSSYTIILKKNIYDVVWDNLQEEKPKLRWIKREFESIESDKVRYTKVNEDSSDSNDDTPEFLNFVGRSKVKRSGRLLKPTEINMGQLNETDDDDNTDDELEIETFERANEDEYDLQGHIDKLVVEDSD